MSTQSPAETIIEALGGLTKTARLLSSGEKKFPISTVQGWKDRKNIPQKYWLPLIKAAKPAGVELEPLMFLEAPNRKRRAA